MHTLNGGVNMQGPADKEKESPELQLPLLFARWALLLAGSLLLAPALLRWQASGGSLGDHRFVLVLFAFTLIGQGLFLQVRWLPKHWGVATTRFFLWMLSIVSFAFVGVVIWWTFA